MKPQFGYREHTPMLYGPIDILALHTAEFLENSPGANYQPG